MTTLQVELYDALISANADDTKARAAAQSVAEIVSEYPKPDELATKKDIAELKAEIIRLMWIQSLTTIGIILTALGIAVAFLSTSTT